MGVNQNYFVRAYNQNDYEAITALWERLGLGNAKRGDTKDVINRTLDIGGRFFLLCKSDTNEIIGTSWLTIDGRRTYIHHFGIDNTEQGKGLAKMLLQASLQAAKSIGLQVKLEVHRQNTIAISLYQKAGFHYLGDYDVYILRDISIIE